MNPRFLKGATWGFPGGAVEHITTHAADVFLVGNRAFKVKKPVKLPYLDFSTVEARRAVLLRELEINRAHAPQVYLEVIDVDGEPVLEMQRFNASDMLVRRVARGPLDDELVARLALTVAEAHRRAPQRQIDGADIMNGLGAQLSQAFTSSPDIFPPPSTIEFHALYEEALRRLAPLLKRRSAQGLVRFCHGDMHCGNIVIIDGQPTLFDAIEFSDRIATIDVLYDLAFLLMDLRRHGQARAANLLLNQYLHLRRAEEDLSGLAALPLFLSTRAGVRALVTADLVHELPATRSVGERGTALDYFRASIAALKPGPPEVLAIGGLSGTGKSTVARAVACDIGAPPGAVHVRSDVERKVLAGVEATARLPAESYSRAASRQTYEAMIARAAVALAAGHSVVLDAVFAAAAERHAAEELARRHGAGFRGLWLEAAAGTMKARVAARTGDASDADAAVVDRQLGYGLGTIAWARIDASGSAAQTLDVVRRTVRPSPAGRA